MTTIPDQLNLLDWNVLRPSADRTVDDIVTELIDLLELGDVDVAALQEISACRRAFRTRIPGYRFIEHDDRSGGDNGFLIRDTLPAGDGWDIEVDDTGFYFTTKGARVWGRSHVTVKVGWCRFTTVHFPPAVNFRNNTGIGAKLRVGVYALQLLQLGRHVKAFLADPAHAVVGDWNEGAADNGPISPGGWARRLGLSIGGGSGIDWLAMRGCTASKPHVVPKQTPGNGSDHPAIFWTLTRADIPTPTKPATPAAEEPSMTTFTRKQWGARAARSGPGAMVPSEVEGVALHWPAMKSPLRTSAAVVAALRDWQAEHMDNPEKKWSDIAYQEAVDQAGNTYTLRGFVTKSGANGNAELNSRFGAILLVIAPGEQPSAKMIATVKARIAAHRKRYPKSTRIVPHSAIRPNGTECPGDIVRGLIAKGVFNPGAPAKPNPVKVDLGKRALERAADQSRNGPTFGKDECLLRVRGLYGAPAIGDFDGDGAADAEDGWKNTKKRHPITPSGGAVPSGVPVWWGGGSADHGHVAVSAGGGMCWSTDIRRDGRFDLVPIAEIQQKWKLPLLGWTEDINGVPVYNPPASPSKEAPVVKLTGVQIMQRELLAVMDKHVPGILAARAKQPGKGVGARAAFASLRTAIKALR